MGFMPVKPMVVGFLISFIRVFSHLIRKFFRIAVGIFIRIVLGLPVKDPTGGFKCFKRAALETLGDFSAIRSFGYSFQMEMNFRMWKAGLRLKEIPITFAERRAGYSKISGSIAVETLKMVFRLRGER